MQVNHYKSILLHLSIQAHLLFKKLEDSQFKVLMNLGASKEYTDLQNESTKDKMEDLDAKRQLYIQHARNCGGEEGVDFD